MSARSEEFLSVYREYETLVREIHKKTPKDLEAELPEADAARMQMCRRFRNYLSHSADPGFLEPTDRMVAYLGSCTSRLRLSRDVAKKHLRKAGVLSPDMPCAEAVAVFGKLKATRLPVACDDRFCVVTVFQAAAAAIEDAGRAVGSLRTVRGTVGFCRPDDLMEDLDAGGITVCTENGRSDGRVLGLVTFS